MILCYRALVKPISKDWIDSFASLTWSFRWAAATSTHVRKLRCTPLRFSRTHGIRNKFCVEDEWKDNEPSGNSNSNNNNNNNGTKCFFRTRGARGGGWVKERVRVCAGARSIGKRRRGQQEIGRGGQGIYRVAFLSIRYPVLEVYSFKEQSIPLRTTLQSSKSCSNSRFLF